MLVIGITLNMLKCVHTYFSNRGDFWGLAGHTLLGPFVCLRSLFLI